MTLDSKLTLAALASAAMPSITVAGVHDAGQTNMTDRSASIDFTVVQDSAGHLYDVYASSSEAGRKRLARRAAAAKTLMRNPGPAGLGFALDSINAFEPGGLDSPTGKYAVLITPHITGEARSLDLLTLEDCASVGTAIGAFHRINSAFIAKEHYPAFTTGQIRAQLTGWIKRLQQAGHIPTAITSSWAKVIETEGLWQFSTCLVHGGFHDGDFVFSGSTINAVTNWQDMQINDPARDLAWIFGKLDEEHRNRLISAYGAMMGSRLDNLIMLRANLWLQMEQVGEFIGALSRADNSEIMRFKAQVEHLAHQLTVATNKAQTQASETANAQAEARLASQRAQAEDDDATGETDRTASKEIRNVMPLAEREDADDTNESDVTASKTIHAANTKADDAINDDTQTRRPVATPSPYASMPAPSSSATMVLVGQQQEGDEINDDTVERDAAGETSVRAAVSDKSSAKAANHDDSASMIDDATQRTDVKAGIPADSHATPTVLIPKLEREAVAERNARIGLDEYESSKFERAHKQRADDESVPPDVASLTDAAGTDSTDTGAEDTRDDRNDADNDTGPTNQTGETTPKA